MLSPSTKNMCQPEPVSTHGMLRYDMIRYEEFNMDSKADCNQLNLAHVARKKNIKKKKLKQTNASAHLVQ